MKFPYAILKCDILKERIAFVSCSNTVANVLYILTDDGEIFLLHISTRTLTKMAISGLESKGCIERLLCHDEFVYIVQWFGAHTGATIYKCIVERGDSLRAIGSCSWSNDRYRRMLSHMLDIKDGYLYSSTSTDIYVVDTETMTLLSTVPLPCSQATDIAISDDGKIHVATVSGVRVYTIDGIYTGLSYLDGVFCASIACTSDGYSVVGMEGKVAIMYGDLTSVYYISASSMGTWLCHVTCDAVDNSLVVMDLQSSRGSVVVVSQKVYRPPFSLSSRFVCPLYSKCEQTANFSCNSKITQTSEKLLILMLPIVNFINNIFCF